MDTAEIVILSYQTDELKWQYAAVILDNGTVRAAYSTFDVADIHRNPLFALKLMQRLEWVYPSVEMAEQAIAQSRRFKCVTDGDLLERLKIDLIR